MSIENNIWKSLSTSNLLRDFMGSFVGSIPKKYQIENITNQEITNNEEFIFVLETLRFWMAKELPDHVYQYATNNKEIINIVNDQFHDFFTKELTMLVNNDLQVKNAIKKNCDISFILYLHKIRKIKNEECLLYGKNDQYISNSNLEHLYHYCFSYGNLELLKYISKVNNPPWNDENIKWNMMNAVEYGYLDIIKYARECGYDLFSKHNGQELGLFYWAEGSSQLEVIKYFFSIGFKYEDEMLHDSVVRKGIEILKFMHEYAIEHGYKIVWDKNMYWHATLFNNLEAIQYLHKNGCPLTSISQILREYQFGCREEDRFECIKYLFDNGFYWSNNTWNLLVEYGQLKSIKYIYDQITNKKNDYSGAVTVTWDENTFLAAAKIHDLEMIMFLDKTYQELHNKKCPLGTNILCALVEKTYPEDITGKFECFKYLYNYGCPCDHEIFINACKNNQKIKEFLESKGYSKETKYVVWPFAV